LLAPVISENQLIAQSEPGWILIPSISLSKWYYPTYLRFLIFLREKIQNNDQSAPDRNKLNSCQNVLSLIDRRCAFLFRMRWDRPPFLVQISTFCIRSCARIGRWREHRRTTFGGYSSRAHDQGGGGWRSGCRIARL
jgi:hypothetical protein